VQQSCNADRQYLAWKGHILYEKADVKQVSNHRNNCRHNNIPKKHRHKPGKHEYGKYDAQATCIPLVCVSHRESPKYIIASKTNKTLHYIILMQSYI
jgi:hypothetical protein